jgi:hypothetical protein
MPLYRIRFMKTLADDTGHERQVCQRAVQVEADSGEGALNPAQALFCELEGIAHWSYRADVCDLEVVGDKTGPQTHAARWPTVAL